jgi:small-conductance mechanosensitive channel
MEIHYAQIIESCIAAAVFILIRGVSNKLINKTMAERLLQKPRAKIIKKGINLTLLIILISVVLAIWGVKQADVAVYIGSILTVVGVAFFAQWSILSNITSSIIIFFNHSIKLEDTIVIMEAKEYEIEGRVSNIGLFFVTIKTIDNEEITLPNNIFIQKMIRKKTNN